jgi:hypothetical protein
MPLRPCRRQDQRRQENAEQLVSAGGSVGRSYATDAPRYRHQSAAVIGLAEARRHPRPRVRGRVCRPGKAHDQRHYQTTSRSVRPVLPRARASTLADIDTSVHGEPKSFKEGRAARNVEAERRARRSDQHPPKPVRGSYGARDAGALLSTARALPAAGANRGMFGRWSDPVAGVPDRTPLCITEGSGTDEPAGRRPHRPRRRGHRTAPSRLSVRATDPAQRRQWNQWLWDRQLFARM